MGRGFSLFFNVLFDGGGRFRFDFPLFSDGGAKFPFAFQVSSMAGAGCFLFAFQLLSMLSHWNIKGTHATPYNRATNGTYIFSP